MFSPYLANTHSHLICFKMLGLSLLPLPVNKTTVHCQLMGTGFAFCNRTRKLYQQRKYCWGKLANRCLMCRVGIYSCQGKCLWEMLPRTGLCISCKCHTSHKGNLSPRLSCSPPNSRILSSFKKLIKTISS